VISGRPRFHPWHARDGNVTILAAVLLVTLLGFAGLGTEVTYVLFKHRQMQASASAAALGGATALTIGYPSNLILESAAIAATLGFTSGVKGVTVTVNHPPVSGNYAGNANAVEVIISQPQTLPLSGLVGPKIWTVGARAVALAGNPGVYCVLAMDPTASGAVSIENNAVVGSSACGVAVNSSSSSALTMSENTTINGPVNVVGGWSLANHAVMPNNSVTENGSPIANPYAGVSVGTVPACTGQPGSAKNNAKLNLTPGHFCAGWNFGNNNELDLAPGTYYIDSQLNVGNNGTITGTGVTLIVNGNYAIQLGNNAQLTLTAETSGPFAGLAIMGLSTVSTATQTFSNNVGMNITGAIYFPHQTVLFSNNGMTSPNSCTQLIADIVQISNNVELGNNCVGTGVKPVGSSPSRLVE